MSADGAETIKRSLPLAEHFYCQLLIVLLVIVKNIYYKLHSFFFSFRLCEKLPCSEQRKLLPQKFSGETGGHISSPQPMFRMPNNRQAGKQACQLPWFFKNPCFFMVAAQFPLMAFKSQAGWNSVLFKKSILVLQMMSIYGGTENCKCFWMVFRSHYTQVVGRQAK